MHGAAVGAICIQTQNLRLVIREHNIEALHLLAAASHDTIVSIHSLLCRSKCAPSHHRIISHFLHISTDLLPINIAAFSSYLVPYHIFEKLFWTILRWFSAHENHYFIHMQRPYTELCICTYTNVHNRILPRMKIDANGKKWRRTAVRQQRQRRQPWPNHSKPILFSRYIRLHGSQYGAQQLFGISLFLRSMRQLCGVIRGARFHY